MGVFSFRFLAICFVFMLMALPMTSTAIAGPNPPVVTVNPGGTANGTGGTSVCDPAIRSMLSTAGSAQAQRDIATISSVIQRPPNAMQINCYAQRRTQLTSDLQACSGISDAAQRNTCIQNAQNSSAACDSMATAWDAAIQDANTAAQPAGGGTPSASATFDRINLYAGATEPVSQVVSNASNKCHPGIPTGVRINGKAEIVCPNPGCAPKLDGDTYKCDTY